MPLLRKLFGPSREEIWRQLSAEIDGRFVKGEFLKGDDLDQLKALFERFAAVLDALCRMGSAYETDPHLDL